ncbi:S9 family peptidase [Fontimonas sp. SYSU GA230001]|uniref:S9 family peptidase n=1 Tax=Fontimonas sp. SYSU GA230001 TaxID=3142450 RepID=UPI0032B550B4
MPSPTPNGPRPFTADDLVRLERVSDPQLSPDGRQVVYTLRRTDWDQNKGVLDLWLLDLKSGQTRQLTRAEGNHSDARWSADGRWIYFLSTRSGSSQVWRLDLTDGGDAKPVTELPLAVNNFALAPDGSRVAVAIDVFPDCADLACSKQRLDERAKQKNSGMRFDKLFIRHWDSWKDGTRSQLFTLTLGADGKAANPVHVSKGIDGDTPSKPFGDASEYAFSPDGKHLVFTARIAGTTEAWSTNLDLWWVPADGSAAPKILTPTNAAMDVGPVFSPDGRYLAWRAMKRPGFEADRFAILLRDLKTGDTREVAPDWDRSADGLAFSHDGKTLYTAADDLGSHRLFAVDVASGKVEALTGAGHVAGFSVGADHIIYGFDTLNSPVDLHRLTLADGRTARLTRHNAELLADVRFGDYEQFRFAGAGGDTVYGHVMKPWNYRKGKKYPVAFIIHGGPQGSMGNDWHYRWNPAVYAGWGYAVVFIDFHGSTGYGQAFTDAISGDWGGKPLEDLQKGWAHALKTYDFLDGDRAAALGASYGGYMINWIAGNWPDAFKALVNHDGIFDNRSMYYSTEELWFDEWEHGGPQFLNPANYEKHNPANHVAQWKTPMLVIHGEKDYRVPPEQGIATFTALQRRGIPSQLLIFPDENHWVLKPQNSVQWHETVGAWLKRWIGN